MNVTLAQITLAASGPHSMPDASIDAETTRLAVQARGGDQEAFCALVDLHQRAARRVARAALGSHTEADDAVQDACVTAWQRIGSLEDPAAFRAWLLRITWRKALDRRRSLTTWFKRVATGPVALPGPKPSLPGLKPSLPGLKPWPSGAGKEKGSHNQHAPASLLEAIADPAVLVDDQLVTRERDEVVAQMIRSLPTRLRDPFLLAAAGEHRYDDIAVMLAIPVGTVKWRVSEARRVLREKLARVGVGWEAGPTGSRHEK